MGRWMKRIGWLPDEVLCSTAARTRQTLDLLELPPTPTRFERSLYLADEDQILDMLRTASAQTVLLLGHNYGIAECAQELVERWPEHPRFEDYPTCATTLIEFDVSNWEEIEKSLGRCVDFAVPREVLATEQPDD